MAEQHGHRPEALADLVEDGVPPLARGSLGTEPGALHLDPRAHRLVHAEPGHLLDDADGALSGAVLQSVVDRRPDHAQRLLLPLEHRGGEQRERVGAARAGHHHRVARLEVGQVTAHAPPYGGDGRVQGHPEVTPGRG